VTFDWGYFWQSLLTPTPAFLQGLALTVVISVVSMILALIVGLAIALMGRSSILPLKVFASGYIWLIRGTPLLVQLVIIYTGFAAAGVFRFEDINVVGVLVKAAVQAAIVGFTLNESAYISEIVRSGLESVDRGQTEASLALGMRPGSAMRWIVVPQAFRIMIPPLGNSFNGLMKSTSILSVIGVGELFQQAEVLSAATFKTFEIFAVVAIYYLALTTIWTFAQTAIENSINKRAGLPVTASVLNRLFGARKGRSALMVQGRDGQ
jgi:polar amino acid transport system permease protein